MLHMGFVIFIISKPLTDIIDKPLTEPLINKKG